MSRKPRKERIRRGPQGITDVDYLYYSKGDFFEAEDYASGKSQEELRAFWDKNRETIMGRYMEANRQRGWAGKRPWPFWKWDMPEPQRPVPPGDYESQKVYDHQKGIHDWVENDAQYLGRIGLLEPWEKEKLS